MDRVALAVLLHSLVLCTSLTTAVAQRTGQLSTYETASFVNPGPGPGSKLNHFIRHCPTGNVFVGAVNSIYRLNSSLELKTNASTAVNCLNTSECLNYNKVLVVEPGQHALITCGSENLGKCQQRGLENLTVTREFDVSVAAGADKTTVSLPAPGPESGDSLYVAATYTGTDSRDPDVSPVSRRYLAQQHRQTLGIESKVHFSNDYLSSPFDINYVYGFSYNGYTYFVTAQQSNTSSSELVSKMLRVCQFSPQFDSYTEIYLQCGKGSSVYNLAQAAYLGPAGRDFAESLGVDTNSSILYAVFAKNAGADNPPSESSALCAFSMADIDEAFRTACTNCMLSDGASLSVSYLLWSRCFVLKYYPEYYKIFLKLWNFEEVVRFACCSAFSLFRFANNPDAVVSTPLLEVRNARMSSIITTTELSHTVAFIGTSSGTLLKVHLESRTFGRHFETVKLSDSPVLTDIRLDDTLQHIYILTEQELLRLRVENCNQYISCESCVSVNGEQDRDPLCGWCTLDNRCTRHSECPMAEVQPNRWLPYNDNKCLYSISDLAPSYSLSIHDSRQMITITVEQLPVFNDGRNFSCQFGDLPATQGRSAANTIMCETPDTGKMPQIPAMEDYVTVKLSLISTASYLSFLPTTLSFYDCSRHLSCTSCVTSDWDCDWCVNNNICKHRSLNCSQGSDVVTGMNNPDATLVQGPAFCPQLKSQNKELLVPVGVPREIMVNASNLPDPFQQVTNYECVLLIEGVMQISTATQVAEDAIRCENFMISLSKYNYSATDKQELTGQLTLRWNGDHRLEHHINVTLYKCEIDRIGCSRCLSSETTRPELGCRWCRNRCSFKDSDACTSISVRPDDSCPAPVLEEVLPATGPIEGNTIIKISGVDIGRRFQLVRNVTVGQQSCDLAGFGDQYVVGKRTAPMNFIATTPITIMVSDVDGSILTSTGEIYFTYKNPVITGVMPTSGPESGGTLMTIDGTDLNTGRNIEVLVAGVKCEIDSINDTAVHCYTGTSEAGNTGPISVMFDEAPRTSSEVFTYERNPTVDNLQPGNSYQLGGRMLSVSGTDFTAANKVTVFVQHNNSTQNGSCRIHNSTLMYCMSPAYTGSMSTQCVDVTLQFMLDGVQVPIAFEYCPDPSFHKFEGNELMVGENYTLRITGERLDLAITQSEFNVTVGNESCPVTDLMSGLIFCSLPEDESRGAGENGLSAVVRWYQTHEFSPGRVVYVLSEPTEEPITDKSTILLATILPTVAVVFLVVLAVFSAKFYKQRRLLKSSNERLLAGIRELHEGILRTADQNQRLPSTEKHSLVTAGQTAEFQGKNIALTDKINIVPEDLQIKFDQLDMGKVLGQGAFGKVYQAVLRPTNSAVAVPFTVAVKTIQDMTDPSNTVKFLEEGLMMKNFDHPNVLGLLGLTFDPQGQPLVVLPFMANGDLKSYILKHSKLSTKQLVMFALHVALGMEYLAEQKFVHRDLAARNCMIDGKLVTKIADFGLSRDLDEADYYTSKDKHAKLPIKWMAPESMARKVYNTYTDVWSYGVLLWELFSGGCTPYPGVPNGEVYSYISHGRRMDPPRSCPPKICGIMQHCWRETPKMRCSFREIVEDLNNLVATTLSEELPEAPPETAARPLIGSPGQVDSGSADPDPSKISVEVGERCEAVIKEADQPIIVHSYADMKGVGGIDSEGSDRKSKAPTSSGYLIPMEVLDSGKGNREDNDESEETDSEPTAHSYFNPGDVTGTVSAEKFNHN